MTGEHIGKPDMSSECTCLTDCICHLHDFDLKLAQQLWNQQAYEYIKEMEKENAHLKLRG